MTTSKRKQANPETVSVVVVVNHDDLRRGERGDVELTDHVRGRLDAGYLRLAEDTETQPGLPPVAGLGDTARRGTEPRGTLLGVQGIPGSVPVGTTGGDTDAGDSEGGTGSATD